MLVIMWSNKCCKAQKVAAILMQNVMFSKSF